MIGNVSDLRYLLSVVALMLKWFLLTLATPKKIRSSSHSNFTKHHVSFVQKKHRSWVSIKQVSHWSSVQMRHSSQRVRKRQPTSIHEGKAGRCSSDGSGDLNALILGFIHHLCTEWVWTSVYFATRQLSSWVVILSCCRLEHHPNLRMGRGHRTSREGT